MGASLKQGPFWGPFIRVPFYFGDPKRDPNNITTHIVPL